MNSREVAGVLRKARAVVSDQTRWCRGALARDTCGRVVKPADASAERWCALGALHVACPVGSIIRMQAFAALRDALHVGMRIDEFNDTATHAQVVDLYDRAICSLEKQLALEAVR